MQQIAAKDAREGQLFHWSYDGALATQFFTVRHAEDNPDVPGHVLLTYSHPHSADAVGTYECAETDAVYVSGDDRVYSADPAIDAQFRARAAASEIEMQRVVRTLMRHYFDCITWDYAALCPEEREMVTREQFSALELYCKTEALPARE